MLCCSNKKALALPMSSCLIWGRMTGTPPGSSPQLGTRLPQPLPQRGRESRKRPPASNTSAGNRHTDTLPPRPDQSLSPVWRPGDGGKGSERDRLCHKLEVTSTPDATPQRERAVTSRPVSPGPSSNRCAVRAQASSPACPHATHHPPSSTETRPRFARTPALHPFTGQCILDAHPDREE